MAIKQLNTLDPKLKETYERVMGTSSQPNVPQPIIQKQTIQPQHLQTQPSPFTKPQPTQQPIQISQPVPFQAPSPQTQQVQAPQATSKKRNKMLPIFLVLTGIVFLIGYTIVWVKIFNLNLPFLPF